MHATYFHYGGNICLAISLAYDIITPKVVEMMRKTSFVALLFLFSLLGLHASFDYRLELFSFDPTYKEYMADNNSPNLSFNYIYNFAGFPDHVYQDWGPEVDVEYPQYFLFTSELAGAPMMGQVKLGETLSLFRNTFSFDSFLSPITIDFAYQGVFNMVMEGEMADMIGYDGVYFYGTTFSIGDFFSLRFGVHHYCTHYGDAIFKRIDSAQLPDFWVTYKYVRMNGRALGISLEPLEGVRIYGEYNWLPKDVESWRPVIFRPSWIDISDTSYPAEYKARIINFGIELSYPIFPSLGLTTLAYDCHLYEEGKIRYKDDSKTGADRYLPASQILYDADAPWSVEHGIVFNQQINPWVSFEIGYHYGRSPLHSFYYLDDASWVYVGARYNPDAGVSLVDTSRRHE